MSRKSELMEAVFDIQQKCNSLPDDDIEAIGETITKIYSIGVLDGKLQAVTEFSSILKKEVRYNDLDSDDINEIVQEYLGED